MARLTNREVVISLLVAVVLLMVVSLGSCDINQDKQECANQLVGLATCIPYVGGEAKSPTPDCCTGLKQVLKTSKKCLCVLVRDRDDPSLGLKINATLALGLPDKCDAPNGQISECPALLHLAPNSPEAKVFNDFGKAAAPTSSTAMTPAAKPSDTTSAKDSSSKNGVDKRSSIAQMLYGIMLLCLTFIFIF